MRARPVRIDIRDIFLCKTRIRHRVLHGFGRPGAVFRRRSDMISIGRAAITGHLRIDFCASRFGVLQLFQYYHSRPFSHHEAAPLLVKRNRTPLRILAGRQRRQRRKTAHTDRTDTALRAARDHHFGVPVLNGTERFTDGICARSAGRHHINALAS